MAASQLFSAPSCSAWVLIGVLASLAAVAVGWALALYVFEFSWNPQAWTPFAACW